MTGRWTVLRRAFNVASDRRRRLDHRLLAMREVRESQADLQAALIAECLDEGMSQAQVARYLGVSQPAIAKAVARLRRNT